MSSSTVSSSPIPSFYTMNGTMSMNGTQFSSGLDTQNMIKALTANISSQIDKEKQMEQKTEWKRSMYHDVQTMLQKFSDTYFSYASGSSMNIMSRSFFSGTNLVSSNPSVVTATGNQTDAGNLTIDRIKQLATAASYMSGQVSNESINSTEALGTTISSSSYLNLSLDRKSYTVSLGKNIDTAHLTTNQLATALQTQLQAQINANSALKDKVTVSVNEAGDGIKLTGTGVTITGASQNFISGLGLSGSPSSYTLDGSTSVTAASLDDLKSQLSGTSLTVNLNGVNKTITFDSSDSSQYSTVDGLATYLNNKLAAAFGNNKISVRGVKANVSDSDDNELSIKTITTDTTSVLTFVSSSDSGVLGTDGLLHIGFGETNRLDLSKTLKDLSGELGLLTPQGNPPANYTVNINGSTFTFNQSDTLGEVIEKINNDPTANVTVNYSQTLDKFRIVSKDTGSQGQIKFQDAAGNPSAGNLGNALFGGAGATTTPGKDLLMSVKLSGGTEQDITRSTNSFTLDGISLNVNGTLNTDTSVTPPPASLITFSGSNTDDLYKKISDFVDQYNAIIDKLNTYAATEPSSQATTAGGGTDYEPLSDDQKKTMTDTEIADWNTKAKQGLLFSDPELISLQSSIRTAMEGKVASADSSLASIGISTKPFDYTSGGKLVINETKLKHELSTEPDKVEQLFTNTDGISSKLRDVLTNNIGYGGTSGILYDIAGNSTANGADDSEFGKAIKDYNKQIKNLQTQLTDKQNSLQKKFTKMEMIISQLASQSDYLSNMASS